MTAVRSGRRPRPRTGVAAGPTAGRPAAVHHDHPTAEEIHP
ncbi:hypothetical protein [Streptomyces sp. A1547]|nr:hypothetical protein [Streptomyces sp. A1547]